eukprot:scaffold6788_cov55-Attheya_sp.AAC.2
MLGGLLRYQLFLVYGVALLSIWYTALEQKYVLVDLLSPTITPDTVTVSSITQGVINCADCPEAAKEIDEQVLDCLIHAYCGVFVSHMRMSGKQTRHVQKWRKTARIDNFQPNPSNRSIEGILDKPMLLIDPP